MNRQRIFEDIFKWNSKQLDQDNFDEAARKKLWDRCYKRCKRKKVDDLEGCIRGELFTEMLKIQQDIEEPDFLRRGIKPKPEDVMEATEEKIRVTGPIRFWGPNEPQETSKDIEREFNRHMTEQYLSGICPRCKSRPCRCRDLEED